MSHIIAITNQKGGVGKTTTTVNLAASLALHGMQVLMIDLDPQGHIGQHLGIQIEKEKTIEYSLQAALSKKLLLSQVIYKTKIPKLFCVPSNIATTEFNQLPPQNNQFILRDIIRSERVDFDFIFLDCQPSLSLLTLNALTACDLVLLPVQAEYLALDGLGQLILTFKEVQNKLHPKLKVLGILLTMFDRRNRLSAEVKKELYKTFPTEIFNTIIPRNIKLAEAPSFGQTIFEYDNSSAGAKFYSLLAEEIMERLEVKT